MLITIGISRFLSDAFEIDARVADNTLQQNFVFAVASLALYLMSA